MTTEMNFKCKVKYSAHMSKRNLCAEMGSFFCYSMENQTSFCLTVFAQSCNVSSSLRYVIGVYTKQIVDWLVR